MRGRCAAVMNAVDPGLLRGQSLQAVLTTTRTHGLARNTMMTRRQRRAKNIYERHTSSGVGHFIVRSRFAPSPTDPAGDPKEIRRDWRPAQTTTRLGSTRCRIRPTAIAPRSELNNIRERNRVEEIAIGSLLLAMRYRQPNVEDVPTPRHSERKAIYVRLIPYIYIYVYIFRL